MQRRDFVAVAAMSALGTTLPRFREPPTGWLPAVDPGPIDAAAFHAMRQFQTTSFGRIAFMERGRGPAALFLHGLPLNSFQWRGALERLAPLRRCIAPDFMGLGYSEIPPQQDLGPEAQADMCVALLDGLKIDEVDLVGSDSGGGVAQLLLARHPKRVRSLLLTNGDTADNSPPAAMLPIIAEARKGTLVDNVMLPWLADKAKARAALGTAYTNPANLTDEAVEVYIRPVTVSPLRRTQFYNYQIALERNALLPVVPLLKRSTVPVQLVWGTGDDIFRLSDAEGLARLFPSFRGTRWVEGGKLFFPEEFPDIMAEEARKLWA
jgi:pimeloyl-ACP methyl ester carboxylesterase